VQEALNDLESSEILSREQAALLRRIYGRELFSVHWELRLLLYGGILILTTGLSLLVAKHFGLEGTPLKLSIGPFMSGSIGFLRPTVHRVQRRGILPTELNPTALQWLSPVFPNDVCPSSKTGSVP